MPWTYRWAVRVPQIYTRGNRVLKAMIPHTTTPAVGTVCRCKANAGLRRSPRGSSYLVLGTTPNGGVKGSTRNGHCDCKCPSARHLCIVRDDTGPLVKELPFSGWWPMNLLAVRVHFLRCSGLLYDWSVKGVLSLVFV
ncbi:hypothetical protein TNCV_2830981 [Trichonephila clavipes]|nr:hypothetical protein TNCV_2830981 [Trichonephila clavipes]